jgi:hypothetical protein
MRGRRCTALRTRRGGGAARSTRGRRRPGSRLRLHPVGATCRCETPRAPLRKGVACVAQTRAAGRPRAPRDPSAVRFGCGIGAPVIARKLSSGCDSHTRACRLGVSSASSSRMRGIRWYACTLKPSVRNGAYDSAHSIARVGGRNTQQARSAQPLTGNLVARARPRPTRLVQTNRHVHCDCCRVGVLFQYWREARVQRVGKRYVVRPTTLHALPASPLDSRPRPAQHTPLPLP